MEKGTSQFFRSAGRCGAMRHGVHAGMPLGCPLPACSWGNNLIFQKTLIFRKSLQICGQGMQPRPWPRHASKAKACIQGMQPRARQPPMGMQRRPGHAAGKGKAAPMGWAGSEGQGMLACMLPRPRHAAKAMACLRGHAGMPLGAGRWARWHAPGRRQQQGPSMHAEGQWQHGEGEACPVGGMPRPWHALGTPTRPWQHLGGLLLPSLDSLFGHLLLFPP